MNNYSQDWNRKQENIQRERAINFRQHEKDQKLNPNCKHKYPDGMGLFYIASPFTHEEKIRMSKTCILCKGIREI